jgi:hypothetical protein
LRVETDSRSDGDLGAFRVTHNRVRRV